MVQFICAFYSKEIILEQFIMKWIDPFYGCAVFVQNGGEASSYLSKTKLASNGIRIFPRTEYHAKRHNGEKWFTVASMD